MSTSTRFGLKFDLTLEYKRVLWTSSLMMKYHRRRLLKIT